MKRLFLCLILFISYLQAKSLESKECYIFDKKYFNQTLKNKADIQINFMNLKTKDVHMGISFTRNIKYVKNGVVFWCYKEKASYFCSQDDDGGNFTFKFKDNKPYLALEHARLSQSTDDEIIHSINSNNKFIEGRVSKCIEF